MELLLSISAIDVAASADIVTLEDIDQKLTVILWGLGFILGRTIARLFS